VHADFRYHRFRFTPQSSHLHLINAPVDFCLPGLLAWQPTEQSRNAANKLRENVAEHEKNALFSDGAYTMDAFHHALFSSAGCEPLASCSRCDGSLPSVPRVSRPRCQATLAVLASEHTFM
jgi:hypothetical protein